MPEVTTVDPATGDALATYPASDVDAALGVLAAVHAGQPAWAARPVGERAEFVRAVGAQLRKQAEDDPTMDIDPDVTRLQRRDGRLASQSLID